MLNYRHLYYFWMVAKEGGFSRAAERLDMAIQTISAQVRELERNLGHQLPAGRTRRGPDRCRPGGLRPRRGNFPDRPGPGAGSAHRRHQAGDPAVRGPVRRHFQAGRARAARPGAGHARPAADLPRRRVRGTAGRTGAASPGSGAGRPGRARQSQPAPDQRPAGVLTGGLVWPVAPAAARRRAGLSAVAGAPARAAAHRPLGAAPDPGPLVPRAGHPSQCGRGIRGQRADVGVRRARPGRVSAQPAGRRRYRPAARPAAAGAPRRGPRGDPRHPQSSGTEPSPGATHPGAGQDFGFS